MHATSVDSISDINHHEKSSGERMMQAHDRPEFKWSAHGGSHDPVAENNQKIGL
ncbi:hypothetical protein [Burkholderia cenocepacia]|uniref:hypothetical protein n=1 Tax=Burkholderia cenocepacia TaxID=95486 RepID=UPI0013E06516|nr:hypothetical protein [Burkholderia cenocepacia]